MCVLVHLGKTSQHHDNAIRLWQHLILTTRWHIKAIQNMKTKYQGSTSTRQFHAAGAGVCVYTCLCDALCALPVCVLCLSLLVTEHELISECICSLPMFSVAWAQDAAGSCARLR